MTAFLIALLLGAAPLPVASDAQQAIELKDRQVACVPLGTVGHLSDGIPILRSMIDSAKFLGVVTPIKLLAEHSQVACHSDSKFLLDSKDCGTVYREVYMVGGVRFLVERARPGETRHYIDLLAEPTAAYMTFDAALLVPSDRLTTSPEIRRVLAESLEGPCYTYPRFDDPFETGNIVHLKIGSRYLLVEYPVRAKDTRVLLFAISADDEKLVDSLESSGRLGHRLH